jgi:hypothetical protein
MGMIEPYFRQKGMVVNRFVYRDEILEPCLLPFIKKYHKHDKYVFWPDQAISHYAKEVQDWLFSKKIEFLPKIINPVNAQKLCPIEDFWGILKTNVYENNWSAKKNLALPEKMDSNLVKKIAGTVQKKLSHLHLLLLLIILI